MLEGGEVSETFEQCLVVQLTFVEQADGFVAEQVAIKRGDAEFSTGVTGLEQTEVGFESHPGVVKVLVGEVPFLGELPKAVQTVVAVVDIALLRGGVFGENEVPLFGDHQEQ